MEDKSKIEAEIENLISIRTAFLNYLDESIPKESSGFLFDFSKNPTLDAKSVYEHFYKLDYQARKLSGILVKAYDIKPR
ncbi:MAG: hypothetical protein GX780_08310 [Campylobacteraceae bacterium]|nr:hypothetical protein [Campylobacteraceae bacterium]